MVMGDFMLAKALGVVADLIDAEAIENFKKQFMEMIVEKVQTTDSKIDDEVVAIFANGYADKFMKEVNLAIVKRLVEATKMTATEVDDVLVSVVAKILGVSDEELAELKA